MVRYNIQRKWNFINKELITGILLIIMVSGTAIGANQMNDCGVISSSGSYFLGMDIWNAGNLAVASCINITASNVVLDGQDHFMAGNLAVTGTYGVYVYNTTTQITNVTIKNLKVANLTYGIYIRNSSNNLIIGNNASNNSNGLFLKNSSNNTIYNNYFSNTKNVSSDGGSNIWNTTKQFSINIIKGPYLGGNVWANAGGNGYSQICTDGNNDMICDSPYVIDANNIDRLPLSNALTTVRYITGIVLDNLSKAGISGATVSANATVSTTTDASGYYVLAVNPGTYNLTAVFEPKYYPNNSLMLSTTGGAVIVQDIELMTKPTGNITGKVKEVDLSLPASVTSLQNVSYDWNYIDWTWTDPEDADFSYVMVYLGGVLQGNVPKGVQYYNAPVTPGTYTVGTRTVDDSGNMNETMVTHTAVTRLPVVRYINGTVRNEANLPLGSVTVSTNTSVIALSNATGFYSLTVTSGTFDLTATFDPKYYTNNSVTVSTIGRVTASQDIKLIGKPTGNITGSVTDV